MKVRDEPAYDLELERGVNEQVGPAAVLLPPVLARHVFQHAAARRARRYHPPPLPEGSRHCLGGLAGQTVELRLNPVLLDAFSLDRPEGPWPHKKRERGDDRPFCPQRIEHFLGEMQPCGGRCDSPRSAGEDGLIALAVQFGQFL